jgi:hypothetical protein
MKWDVAMMALMKCMEAEQICDWTGGGGSPFILPRDGGGIVRKVVDGVGPNVERLGQDVELSDGGSELKIAVGD